MKYEMEEIGRGETSRMKIYGKKKNRLETGGKKEKLE